MSERAFFVREERRRHQLPGAPREQRKQAACTSLRSIWACSLRHPSARRDSATKAAGAQPSVATLTRSAPTVDAELPIRSRCTRQRMDASPSSNHATRSSSTAFIGTMTGEPATLLGRCQVPPRSLTASASILAPQPRRPGGPTTRSNTPVAAWTKPAIVIASGMLALGGGIGVASVASADTTATPNPTTTPSSIPTPSSPPPGTERPDWPTSPQQDEREAALIKVLSEMLGVDEAEVKAALDQVRAAYEAEGPAAVDAWLDEAVRSGILTQAEADAIRQAVEEGLNGGY
jgi:hypothetical protein